MNANHLRHNQALTVTSERLHWKMPAHYGSRRRRDRSDVTRPTLEPLRVGDPASILAEIAQQCPGGLVREATIDTETPELLTQPETLEERLVLKPRQHTEVMLWYI